MDLERILVECGVAPATAQQFTPPIEAAFLRFNIDDRDSQAMFLAHTLHESGKFERRQESLNYRVEALLSTFGRHRISEADARRWGRDGARPADQQAIANAVYGGPWGAENLGNTQPGDGWRYRGRGLIQLTGRANYASCSRNCGRPYLDEPDLVAQPADAVLTAAWFWSQLGMINVSMAETTRRVNGGETGAAERLQLYHQLQRVMR